MFQRGFTLLELLIVIAIIGILSTVVLAALDDSRRNSRNEAVISQMNEYQKALELNYSDTGQYPRTNVAGTARYCIGDDLSPGEQCMGSVTNAAGYSAANSAAAENAFRAYMSTLQRFDQPRGAYTYSSPAYSGCAGVGMANTSCTTGDYSIWFLLEGTNEDCGGRSSVANATLVGEYTLCRLSSS